MGQWGQLGIPMETLSWDWTTTAKIRKVGSGFQPCTRMCVHTLGFLQLFQGLGITEPEVWGNSLRSGKAWGQDQPP